MHSTDSNSNTNMNAGNRYNGRLSDFDQADMIARREYSPKHLQRPISSFKMSDLPDVGNVAVAYAKSTGGYMKSAKPAARFPKPAQLIMTLLAAASLTVPLLCTIPAQAAEADTATGKATDTVAKHMSSDVVEQAKGYMDSYMSDLTDHRNRADGRADAIAAAYNGYIDDADIEELHTYESYAKAASNSGEADEWVAKIDGKEGEAKAAKETAEAKKAQQEAAAKQAAQASSSASSSSSEGGASASGGFMTVSQFKFRGAMNWNGHRWTYYSETVLPGSALNIPGRHVANGAVCDVDGYVVLASCDYAKGTVIDTPIGKGKVYDYCPTSGTIDLYVH